MAKPYPTGSVVPLGVCSSVHLFTFGAEMGLHRGVQALGYAPRPLYSRCVRFSRCGSRGLSCSTARGNLVPRSGVEPFPVLLMEGGCLTTGPSGKLPGRSWNFTPRATESRVGFGAGERRGQIHVARSPSGWGGLQESIL